MKKYFFTLLILGVGNLLVASTATTDNGYDSFCGTQAEKLAKAIDTDDHVKKLKEIEELKKKYNSSLADQTIDRSYTELLGKAKIQDPSSVLLWQMINEMLKESPNKSLTYETFCKNHLTTVELCGKTLPKEVSAEVLAIYSNFYTECSYVKECENSYTLDKYTKDANFQLYIKNFLETHQIDVSKLTAADFRPDPSAPHAEPENRATIIKKINDLQDPKFNDLESLKKFIAEKYTRSCSGRSPPTEIHSNCGAGGIPSVFDVKFADYTFSIVGALASQQGDHTFLKKEINVYKQLCERNSADSVFADTCKIISQDYEDTQKVREPQDWAKIHEDNYVVSDPTNPEGFRIVPKASNATLAIEALGPIFNNFVPFWISDIQSQAQINMMTQQAMATKQAQVNYNTYSANGYFQPSTSFLPTASSGPSLTTGFNFGP